MLDGLPLLTIPPDFAQPPRLTGKRAIHTMAKGQARRLGIYPTGGTQHVLAHRYAFTTRVEARAFEDFFNARSGAWEPFFVPGWHAELNPLQSLAPGNTSLAISPVNYAAVYLDAAKKTRTGWHIYLLNEAGDLHASKVTAATSGSPELLTLQTAVPSGMNFLLGSYHVGFCYLVRFMGDHLAMEFSGPEFVTTETSFLELIDPTT